MPYLGEVNASPFPGTVFKSGSSGDNVKKIQQRLKDLGKYSGAVDGNFNSSVVNAVKALQGEFGINKSGQVDLTTWNLLFNNNDAYAKYPYPKKTYKKGMSGDSVNLIEQALITLGFMSGSPDNSYDGTTESAVKAFQKSQTFLAVDGMVGPNTWGELFRLFEEAKQPPKPIPRKDMILERVGDEDNESGNPLVPWYKPTGVPPAYQDDILPPHRVQQGAYFLRLGDCQFFIPPLFIRVNNNTPTQRIPTIRQRESMNINSGYSNRDIEISLWFNDLEQVNGTPIPSGPNGEVYYMDGLRSLIAQFKKSPFVPVVNEWLNGIHGIYAVTLLTMTAQTVPELPGCLQVKLTLKEFNAQPLIGLPTPTLDLMYCWPLFRWFYQQPLMDGTTRSKYKYPKVSTNEFTGQIKFRVLPEYLLAMLPPNANPDNNKYKQYEYLEDEWAFMEEIPLQYEDFQISDISISIGNIVTNLQLAHYPSPTHQFLGSLDTMVSLNILTQSKDVASDFVKLHQLVQDYSRNYKNRITTGYIGVENELINMYGVDCVTIQNMDVSTVEGQPDLISIRIDLLSYNKTQREQEKADGMAPHKVLDESDLMIGKDISDYKNPIITDGVIEDMINELELYPDLELPTYTVVRETIDKMNATRKAQGYKDIGITSADFKCPYKKVAEIVKEPEKVTKEKEKRNIKVFPGTTYKKGDNNQVVKEIKESLAAKKRPGNNQIYFSGTINTSFDDVLKSAVKLIQDDYKHTGDGEVNHNTWDAIFNMNLHPSVTFPTGEKIWSTKSNSSSANVKKIQDALKELGYDVNTSGGYTAKTKTAVTQFQKDSGFLQQDGVVGINTWGELFTRVFENRIPPVIEKRTTDDSYFVDPDFYIFYPSPIALGLMDETVFNTTVDSVRAGAGNGMLDQVIKKGGSGAAQAHDMMQMLNQAKAYRVDHGVRANLALEEETQDIPNIKDQEYYKLMAHDAWAHSRRYAMVRAFPTAMFLFVDEGQRVHGIRMWSNYYAYHSLVSINITRDRDNPVDLCELVISNIYQSLSTTPSYTKAAKKGIWDTWFIAVDEEMKKARKKLYSFMALQPGCRIHLRMGYGSAPQGLPIVFNGTIANMDHGDVMTIIAQSDGAELTNPIHDLDPKDNSGFFKYGNEPSNIIRTLMGARNGFQAAFTWTGSLKKLGDLVNGSRYGIEHFGYVYPKEDWKSDLKALFHLGDQGRWSYDQCKNVYKGPPFIADTGDFRRTTLHSEKWFSKDEDNIYMFLFGKSPWDIFKGIAAAGPDYIVTASPHNFRSTLFYGQPQWLYKYGFKYVGGNDINERKDLKNYYELIKTYQQLHFIDSFQDIIDNGLQANSMGIVTAVIPIYTEGETTKTDMLVYADKNIYPEYQKTAFYDTTMMQDMWLHEALWTGAAGKSFEWARNRARMMGVSYLQHSFKDMYKGEIVILGDAAIKPYDFLFITDTYREIFGPAMVGRVTHSMSLETGFTTSIKPDLITVTQFQDSVPVTRTISAAQLFAYNIFAAKSAIVTAATVDKAVKEFSIRNKKIADWEKGLDVFQTAVGGVIAGSLLLGPAGLGAALLALTAWVVIDKAVEWAMNIFSGRDNNTIAAIPLMHKNKPLIAGMKGHQTLIPGYYDEDTGEPTNLVQTEDVNVQTMNKILQQHQSDWNAMIAGRDKRKESGVDIFRLKPTTAIDWKLERNFGTGGSGGYGAVRDKILAEARRIVGLGNGPTGEVGYVWAGTGQTLTPTILASLKRQYGASHYPDKYMQMYMNCMVFDCSGFTHFVFKEMGIPIANYRMTAQGQYDHIKKTGAVFNEMSEAKPGDLVFFSNSSLSNITHVAIVAGNDKTLEARSTEHGLMEYKITGRYKVVAFGRTQALIQADQSSSSSSGGSYQAGNKTKGLSQAQFIELISSHAVKKYKETKLWASLIIANACQESSYGQSNVAINGNNLFGIKAYSSWKGKTVGGAPKSEDGGKSVPYRAYDSFEASIDDFVSLIMNSDRYAPIRNAKDPYDACRFYQTGYAGDSSKDNQLKNIIRTRGLQKYDAK